MVKIAVNHFSLVMMSKPAPIVFFSSLFCVLSSVVQILHFSRIVLSVLWLTHGIYCNKPWIAYDNNDKHAKYFIKYFYSLLYTHTHSAMRLDRHYHKNANISFWWMNMKWNVGKKTMDEINQLYVSWYYIYHIDKTNLCSFLIISSSLIFIVMV